MPHFMHSATAPHPLTDLSSARLELSTLSPRLAQGVRQGHLGGVRQGTRMRSGLTTMIAIALAREVATFSRCRS